MLWALSAASFFRWSENSEGVASEGCTETMASLARWAMRATTAHSQSQSQSQFMDNWVRKSDMVQLGEG